MSQLPGMTSFRLCFQLSLDQIKLLAALHEYLYFKELVASARASAFISRRFRTGRFFSLSNTGCIALPGRNFLLSNPCSVWDCKGRNLFLLCKIYFNIFSKCLFRRKPTE